MEIWFSEKPAKFHLKKPKNKKATDVTHNKPAVQACLKGVQLLTYSLLVGTLKYASKMAQLNIH